MKNCTYFTRPLSGPSFQSFTFDQYSIFSEDSNSVNMPRARLTARIARESPAAVFSGIGRAAF